MERESAHIAPIQDTFGLYFLIFSFNRNTWFKCISSFVKCTLIIDFVLWNFQSESMSSIIYNLQAVYICNFLDATNITWFTIAMYRHNGCRLWGYSRFNLFGIEITGTWIDIYKYRLATSPPDRMSSGYETIWSGNYLASDPQCLKCRKKRKGTICKKADLRNTKILLKC